MMLFQDFKRIFGAGAQNFQRNVVVSFASILMTTTTLIVIGVLIFSNAAMSYLIDNVEEKVDINIYFYPTAGQESMLALSQYLEGLPEVEEVAFISRQEALEAFRERHADDPLILSSLDELGTNPLGASLNVRAVETSQYGRVAAVLEDEATLETLGVENIIERVNYSQNKEVIQRLDNTIEDIRMIGLWVTLFFVVISVLVLFTTTRLGIYAAREEISIMRLVGAPNRYIRGPFFVEGVLVGVISTILALLIFFVALDQSSEQIAAFLGGFDLYTYYVENFAEIISIFAVTSIVLGVGASILAMRRYLRV